MAASFLAGPLDWFYWATLLGYGGALAAAAVGAGRLKGLLALAALLANALAMAWMIWQAGRAPITGPYETIMAICLLLGLLAGWDWLRKPPGSPSPGWSWALCAALLLVLAALPRQPGPDFYMFNHLWTNLFFQMRLASAALLLYAAACFAPTLAQGAHANSLALVRRGRIFLLAGWSCFLAGEFAGAIWSFNWMGDFWHWSAGFLESTMLFLVVAIPLHLTARLASSALAVALSGMLPGLLLAVLTLVKQVGQS